MQDDIGSSYTHVRLEGLDDRELWNMAARLVDDCGPYLGQIIMAQVQYLRRFGDHREMDRWIRLLNRVEQLNGRRVDALH